MTPQPKFHHAVRGAQKQRGVVLFLALVALLAMSLAAVALIRSVDTGAMVAGNLAFRQSATSSSDAGIEAAMRWLRVTQAANAGGNFLLDATHPFNQDAPANGYYASLGTKSLTAGGSTDFQWDDADSKLIAADGSGNSSRYIIQRMCRISKVAGAMAECLYSSPTLDKEGQEVKLPQDVCPKENGGCPVAGQTPQIRITVRTTGPRNTLSYVQAFVY